MKNCYTPGFSPIWTLNVGRSDPDHYHRRRSETGQGRGSDFAGGDLSLTGEAAQTSPHAAIAVDFLDALRARDQDSIARLATAEQLARFEQHDAGGPAGRSCRSAEQDRVGAGPQKSGRRAFRDEGEFLVHPAGSGRRKLESIRVLSGGGKHSRFNEELVRDTFL